jgi:ribosome maturation factor RimP
VQRNKRNVIVRLTLDRVEGELTVGDCEAVSKKLSSALDVHELISGRYYLEVSSPGVERPLRNLEECRRFIGRLAFFEFEDGRTILGDIVAVEGDKLTIAKKDGSQELLTFGTWRQAHLKLDLEKALKKKIK